MGNSNIKVKQFHLNVDVIWSRDHSMPFPIQFVYDNLLTRLKQEGLFQQKTNLLWEAGNLTKKEKKFIKGNQIMKTRLELIGQWAKTIDKGKGRTIECDSDDDLVDAHTLSGLLKYYLHTLPEPLVPYSQYKHVITASKQKTKMGKIIAYRSIFSSMLDGNRNSIDCILKLFLNALRPANQSINELDSEIIGNIFAKYFLTVRPPMKTTIVNTTMDSMKSNSLQCAKILSYWIEHYDDIFLSTNEEVFSFMMEQNRYLNSQVKDMSTQIEVLEHRIKHEHILKTNCVVHMWTRKTQALMFHRWTQYVRSITGEKCVYSRLELAKGRFNDEHKMRLRLENQVSYLSEELEMEKFQNNLKTVTTDDIALAISTKSPEVEAVAAGMSVGALSTSRGRTGSAYSTYSIFTDEFKVGSPQRKTSVLSARDITSISQSAVNDMRVSIDSSSPTRRGTRTSYY